MTWAALWGGGAITRLNNHTYMAKLARNCLAVQAPSAASERLFSQGGLVVMAKHNRMSGETAADRYYLSPRENEAQPEAVCCKRR